MIFAAASADLERNQQKWTGPLGAFLRRPSTPRRNLIANFVGRGWPAASVLIFAPLYLKALGPEAYGLVAFYNALSSVLYFADFGFTSALNRELARLFAVLQGSGKSRSLVLTMEVLFF